jgi:hypothetical protein
MWVNFLVVPNDIIRSPGEIKKEFEEVG